MHFAVDTKRNSFSPRLIVWQLTFTQGNGSIGSPFTTHECMLTVDSIARTAKPIVVLTGPGLLMRSDVYDIVEYGFALGLKLILEVKPADLLIENIERFHIFGSRVFRLLLDGCIVEHPDTRYKLSPEFTVLERAVCRLKKSGFEVHLGVTVREPDTRQLAYEHDYAFRHSAKGLYCHLCFDDRVSGGEDGSEGTVEDFIDSIAEMKQCSPKSMYLSPQCVKYAYRDPDEFVSSEIIDLNDGSPEWVQSCLGGKTYAFINPFGGVQVCAGLSRSCGELRSNRYDFRKIWNGSEVFQRLRETVRSCTQTWAESNDESPQPASSEGRDQH